MNIYLLTTGTRGDVQPFVALALGLRDAGDNPTLVVPQNEAAFVRSFGLNCVALSVDIQKITEDREIQAMAKGDNPLTFIRSHLAGSNKMKELMVNVQEEVWEASKDADVLVYHPGMANAFLMAQERGIPSIMASPFPLTATREFPAILLYTMPHLGHTWNLLSHRVFETMFWLLGLGAAQEFWRRRGKANIVPRTPPSRLHAQSGQPIVYGYSRHLFPQPNDWPANIHVTGTWTITEEPAWEAPQSLTDFLTSGDAPVYFGFGSIKDPHTFEATVETVLEAAQKAGVRAVISLGWSALPDGKALPQSTYLLGSVPHSWLFPQMVAVVHHGGAGTTAAGLRAGKPTVIIPHTADQPAWGRRVFELGVGPQPIPKKRLNADNLAAAIRAALQPSVREQAATLGAKMQEEPGVQAAVQTIHSYLQHRSLQPHSFQPHA